MAGLVPATHAMPSPNARRFTLRPGVDARDERGHDAREEPCA